MKKVIYCIGLSIVIFSCQAFAWDNIVIGKIGRITLHTPFSSARHATVSLVNVPTLCSLTSNNDTAYLLKGDMPDTFDALYSGLLAAKLSGIDVRLYVVLGDHGCQIGRVDLDS